MKRAVIIGEGVSGLAVRVAQAAFDAAGTDARAEAWETTPEQLEGRVDALRSEQFAGAAVARPHREAIAPLLDGVEGDAERAGLANAVVVAGDRLAGHNTLTAAFARALRQDAGFDPKGRRAAILGSGAAARAVSLALVDAGAAYVLLAGRAPRRLEGIVARLRGITPAGTTATWCHWMDGTFLTYLPAADLIVNCTSVGSTGSGVEGESLLTPDLLPAQGLVFDLVAEPADTPLLEAARSKGLQTQAGAVVLVYELAEDFRLWTRQEPPLDAMRAAAGAAG